MAWFEREFIAVPEDRKNQLVYKWPDVNIRRYTRAMVNADELALFVKAGRVVAAMGPGRHRIDADELPVLGALVDTVTGGNFYRAELLRLDRLPHLPRMHCGHLSRLDIRPRRASPGTFRGREHRFVFVSLDDADRVCLFGRRVVPAVTVHVLDDPDDGGLLEYRNILRFARYEDLRGLRLIIATSSHSRLGRDRTA